MSEKEYCSAELSADVLKDGLTSVIAEAGLNLSILARQGCICCDVGAGAEILAMNDYQPRILIASEPLGSHNERKKIETSLAKVKTMAPVELIRDHPEAALQLCARKKIKVGLVTWLNIFPEKYYRESFIDFFKLAKPLLINGGAAVASVDWIDPGYWGGPGELVMAMNPVAALGYKVDCLDRENGNSAGGVFLIGTKLS